MLAKHYAPKTKIIRAHNILESIRENTGKKIGVLSFKDTYSNVHFQVTLSSQGNLEEAASKLYASLHEMDSKDLDIIIAEHFPNIGLGKSINDRLERATK